MRNRSDTEKAGAFDQAYYKRFYVNSRTRVISAAETHARAQWIASFVQQMDIPVRKILDMGCGLGGMRPPLLKTFPGARYSGVEISEYACKRYGWTHASIQTFKTREAFDLVICVDVVQYLDDKEAAEAIKSLSRWCRGVLYFFAPTTEDWQENVDHSVTDINVHVRDLAWYQKHLRKYFTHLGNGFFIKRDVPFTQWAIQQP